ncbi:hypothetical protein K469DRAFT_731374 [Zopfia rhizophila CBS 207.26]|uniref:Uncharacterized protein n=1 Tax=Zopfia rhizophila CBS 207.26 TaxID=1314779 RepID=A0A6A6DHH4_9PEZI|nr:hypothetical protein K469DRAFT_731374 [Zopfia rhizophila CBS 207.26]
MDFLSLSVTKRVEAIRVDGVITTLGDPFKKSQQQEINGLVMRGHSGVRIFNSRLINKVKGKAINTPFKKASQRVIIAITPSLYPPGTIMIIRKPLYEIPEAGTHWWATYYKYHKKKLFMITLSYDPCLLITIKKGVFRVVGMLTDDTLFLASKKFTTLKDSKLQKAYLTAKPRDKLSTESNLIFNRCVKDQGKKLQLQRARGAYIALIYQPEASFNLSVAAQHQNPTTQIKNMNRGIKYIALDLEHAKLFVFVDSSFTNNKDFSSQIGYLIILANENETETDPTGTDEFVIKENLIHYSSTKSKRITRSVLASEIYGMIGGVDMAIAINTTIKIITKQLGFLHTPVIICTDSYSLYECLVKLGTTKEKRLMIDIMALRQSYERREITEIQ